MRKYVFCTFIITSALHVSSLSSCPYGFSSDDKRPFFEQYEIEPSTTTQEEKEKST